MNNQVWQVSIIIPVFNNWHLTRQCLESLRQHTPGNLFEVLVVDNGSTDGTGTYGPSLGNSLFGPNFRHLRLKRNINFGPACNLGAKESQAPLLFFLNNDTILTPNWWPPLLAGLKAEAQVGAVGPLLLYPGSGPWKDRVQHLGIAVEPQLYPVHLYEYFPHSHPLVRKKRYFQALTGAALLLPKKIFLEFGGFFEGYINGGEDVDLGCHLRQQGKLLSCVTESRIYHLVGQTPGRHLHEKHNGEVLKSRCLHLLIPDLHLFTAGDGYELRLSPWLRPYLILPERRKKILERQLQDPWDLAQCQLLLGKEPVWVEGYEKLAASFEAENDFAGAVPWRFLQCHFLPHRQTFVKLLETARRAGDEDQMAFAQRRISLIDQVTVRRDFYETATFMLNYARQLQQPALVGLYENWLEKTYPELNRFPESMVTAGMDIKLRENLGEVEG
ncbi:MAG: hypothetical protein A2Y80_10515 [Deltaproteobacteria bacterium RBG_13_58_19]|nr:MAG: hypothetical protein A2Y80_10515 [Deltaproteobacteria bacterium RBG_13_58_19]